MQYQRLRPEIDGFRAIIALAAIGIGTGSELHQPLAIRYGVLIAMPLLMYYRCCII
jgi:hypothetical protein